VGFAHGVMNTDNMSILGLTLDYGPYGFLDQFDPAYICNHSDHSGRYAFDQQPEIGAWNVTCLAQALSPLMSVEQAKAALSAYHDAFGTHYIELMSAKLGAAHTPDVVPLITGLLEILQQNHVDYTIFFRRLNRFKQAGQNDQIRDLFLDRAAFDAWATLYHARLQQEGSLDAERATRLDRVNPKYILRNYMAQVAIQKAVQDRDYTEVNRLLALVQNPFDEHPEMAHYAGFPPDWASSIEVSCSS
jgi:uncharacterized protein YdiU (UPF0061 family)